MKNEFINQSRRHNQCIHSHVSKSALPFLTCMLMFWWMLYWNNCHRESFNFKLYYLSGMSFHMQEFFFGMSLRNDKVKHNRSVGWEIPPGACWGIDEGCIPIRSHTISYRAKKKKWRLKGSKTRYPCILAVIEIIQFRMNANYIKIEKKLVLKQENGCLKSLSYN